MSGLARAKTELQELFVFGWQFQRKDLTPQESMAGVGAWRPVQLPHDWSRDYPYDEHAASGGTGGYVETGIGWYRKVFTLPPETEGRRRYILFGGVYMDADVYLNGERIGGHYSGYTPFELDITDQAVCGENVLCVRVNNGDQPNSRWYTGSGIYRDVWLKTLGPVHVTTYGTRVVVDEITDISARVNLTCTLRNTLPHAQRAILRSTVYDAEGNTTTNYAMHRGITLQPGDNEVEETLGVPMPRRWSVEDPYLYTVVTRLFIDGETVDEYHTRFGIRSLEYCPRKGLLLNGKHVKVIGGAVHQDGGGVGAAVPKKVWDRRLRILKESGLNAIRTAHNMADEGLLEACDEQGFLVMDELFDEWRLIKESKSQLDPGAVERGYGERFDELYAADLEVFLRRDRNHPSVIMWSIGNEVVEQTKHDGPALARAMKAICRAMDDRPVTVGCDFIAAEPLAATEAFLNELDIVGYNYVTRWRGRAETYYMDDKLAHPEWMQIGSENGGVRASSRGQYLLEKPEGPGFFRAMPYTMLATDGAALFRYTMTRDFVIGDYIWTVIDYLGEARWPGRSASSGVLDTCGFRKDNFYFYKAMLNRKSPTLHLMPHWNMDVEKGRIIPVMCYSSVPEVELFVNGKSYGRKVYAFPRYGMRYFYGNHPDRVLATTNDLWLTWDVEYEPGVVEAVGYEKGEEVIRTRIVTAGEAAAIRLDTEDTALCADGRDIAQIEVTLLDEDGNEPPMADNELVVAVTGAGKLLALDNGQSTCKVPFTSDRMPAFGGKLLVTVQAAREEGALKVSVSGKGLRGAAITIPVGGQLQRKGEN